MGKVIWGHLLLTLGAAAVAYWPKFFSITGNEMGYCVMAYCLIFPLLALICCFMCGLRGVFFGLSCAFFTIIFAVIIPYPVFGGFWKENILLPGVGAVMGVAISCAIDRFIRRRTGESSDYDHLNP